MQEHSKRNISNLIKAEAKRLGFSDCGISRSEELSSEKKHLENWLKKGYHAGMDYMNNNQEKRLNPMLLVPNARSVISVNLNYFYGEPEYKTGHPKISKYALGRDYHKVMKKMLKQLFTYIQSLDSSIEGRYFVDSAPVLDKAWAEKSGLGWKGKHGLIINKDRGSFLFIGEIICNLDLEYDQAVSSYCGNCQLCIDACPTNAIREPYLIDANRCISYQTIETNKPIPSPIVKKLSNYIFGCDICQDVCPWNKKSVITEIKDFGSRLDLLDLNYEDYKNMSEESFNKTFNGTPLKRSGYQKIQQTINQISNSKRH